MAAMLLTVADADARRVASAWALPEHHVMEVMFLPFGAPKVNWGRRECCARHPQGVVTSFRQGTAFTPAVHLHRGGRRRRRRPTCGLAPQRRSPKLQMSTARLHQLSSESVVIIGGGIIGLSTALEVKRRRPSASVAVISRSGDESASMAAGGMLAPQAERLAEGALLDLCLASRSMYPEFVQRVEAGSGSTGGCGYDSAGVLAPAWSGDAVHRWRPPPLAGPAHFLTAAEARLYEPGLTADTELAGAWYFPSDAQVDNRALMPALRAACQQHGVLLLDGQEVVSWCTERVPSGYRVRAVQLTSGVQVAGEVFVLASGAWARDVLAAVPVRPQKGQMVRLAPPPAAAASDPHLPLRHVLFAEQVYAAPKRRAQRLYVGATVEEVGFDGRCTVGGVHDLLRPLLRLYPALQSWTLDRMWSGFRPLTPDRLPILGRHPRWNNLQLALGHWRNGILLAPLTASLMADDILGQALTAVDPRAVHACRYERFTGAELPSMQVLSSSSPKWPPSSSQVEAAAPYRADGSAANDRTLLGNITEEEEEEEEMLAASAFVTPDTAATASAPASPPNPASPTRGAATDTLVGRGNGVNPPASTAASATGGAALDLDPATLPGVDQGVTLWRVLDDGRLDPVPPPSAEDASDESMAERYLGRSDAPTPAEIYPTADPRGDDDRSEGERGTDRPRDVSEVEWTRDFGTSNDAYDDVYRPVAGRQASSSASESAMSNGRAASSDDATATAATTAAAPATTSASAVTVDEPFTSDEDSFRAALHQNRAPFSRALLESLREDAPLGDPTAAAANGSVPSVHGHMEPADDEEASFYEALRRNRAYLYQPEEEPEDDASSSHR